MDTQIKKLFASLDQVEPGDDLRRSILARVNQYQRTRAFRLMLCYYAATVASIVAIIPATQSLIQSLDQSGLYRFVSLLFTDTDILARQWQSFSLSIIEAIPIIELSVALSLVLFFSWSILSINKMQFKNKSLQIKTT